jgi:hypothetical protein
MAVAIAAGDKCRVYRNGTQLNTASGWQLVQLNAVSYNARGTFDPTTTFLYTVPDTRPYRIGGRIQYVTVTACRVAVGIYKNGAIASRIGDWPLGAGGTYNLGGVDEMSLTAGDTIGLYYYSSVTDGGIQGAWTFDAFMAISAI